MLPFGAVMLLSAFLLFLVQPLIGKCILPWFGGTPAVWTACSSVMLLATTNQMCQDVAVVPLLWILPLALYLLTYILCFQYQRIYRRPLFICALAGSIAWSCFVLFGGIFLALELQILSYCLTLFASCMVCHGERVRLRIEGQSPVSIRDTGDCPPSGATC
jgi:hypothetical protein